MLPKRDFFAPFLARVQASGLGRALLLAGPLRAGKTVLLRQLVAHLIEQGVPPERILYASFATPSYASADFAALVAAFARERKHEFSAELHILLDEIHYAPEFEKLLLALARAWPKARVVGAASALSPTLATGATSAGGRIETFVLPPLTFAEFLAIRGRAQELFAPSPPGGNSELASLKSGALPALDAEFQHYVNFGSFPEGIAGPSAAPPAPGFVRDHLAERALRRDLAGLAGIADAAELSRVLLILARDTGRETGIDDLAKAAGIAKNTLRKYHDFLEQAFLIRRLERLDQTGQRFQRAVAFKPYLVAPSLRSCLLGPASPADAGFAHVAETALAAQWLGAPDAGRLAHASWREGRVDLVALDANTKPLRAFEVDWQDAYAKGAGVKGPRHLVGFIEAANPQTKAFVLTRVAARPARMRQTDVTLVPLALFAYWAGRETLARLAAPPAKAAPAAAPLTAAAAS
jgi:predicted AAA+ superfamily ATPase